MLGGSALPADARAAEDAVPAPAPAPVVAKPADAPAAAEKPRPADDPAQFDFANGLYARKMYVPAAEEYRKYLESYPLSPQAASALFRRADSLFFLKEYQASLALFEDFTAKHATDKRADMARLRTASAHFALGRPRQAVVILTGLIGSAADPEVKAAARYYLAKSYQSSGRPGRAVRELLALCRDHAGTEYASYAAVELGEHHRSAGRLSAAEKAYRIAAANAEPAELRRTALYRLGEVLYARGQAAAARESYLAAIEAFGSVQALSSAEEEMRHNALLGVFYCDLRSEDLAQAQRDATGPLAPLIDKSPNEAEILYLLAVLHARQGLVEAAVQLTGVALERGGLKPEALQNTALLRAQLLTQRGETEAALKTLQDLPPDVPDLLRVNYEKAELLRLTGRDQDALVHYRAIVDGHPDSVYAKAGYYQAGLLYLGAGYPNEARQMFGHFVDKYPSDPIAEKAGLEIVQIDLDAERYAEAEKGALAVLASHPAGEHHDISLYKLGVAQAALSKMDEAASTFLRIASEHPGSFIVREALYGAATSYEAAGKLRQAVDCYDRMIALDDSDDDARHVLARLGPLYLDLGELDKAADLYLKALTSRHDVALSEEQMYWLVQHLLDKSQYERMQQALAAVPARFPGSDLSHEIEFFMGESSIGLKKYAEALAHYRKAVELKPGGRFAAHAHLGAGLAAAAQGDAAAAGAAFNEALRFDQEIRIAMRARYEIAVLRHREGDLLEAAKAYMMVAILYDDPSYTPMALYKAGECFARADRPDESRKAYAEIVSRYPESEWARKVPQDAGGPAR
ncbi:MAG: Outer membrane protein assembly factor BamD [Candidatus Omnitrophica bacterium]|nr:Outer membrane protein assembly factor BamD [Candidatus Omnitrophota bacterium]